MLIDNETIDFKKVVSDFLPIAKSNYKIIALEKAVASYIMAILNKKEIISFTWKDWFAEYGQALMKWLTIIISTAALCYTASIIVSWIPKSASIFNIPTINGSYPGFSNFTNSFFGMEGGKSIALSGKTALISAKVGAKVAGQVVQTGFAIWSVKKVGEKMKDSEKNSTVNITNVEKEGDDNVDHPIKVKHPIIEGKDNNDEEPPIIKENDNEEKKEEQKEEEKDKEKPEEEELKKEEDIIKYIRNVLNKIFKEYLPITFYEEKKYSNDSLIVESEVGCNRMPNIVWEKIKSNNLSYKNLSTFDFFKIILQILKEDEKINDSGFNDDQILKIIKN